MKNRAIKQVNTGVSSAAAHGLGWFCIANGLGVLLATLLIFPDLGMILGEWTYGRLMPLHLNLQLYGWLSLPLIGLLFFSYETVQTSLAKGARIVVWMWSAALVIGCVAWLSGVSSGKIFLDWKGAASYLFIAVMLILWGLLAGVTWLRRSEQGNWLRWSGVLALLPVPLALYMATQPELYPPVNPDTGGPTGSSLLGSSLSVIFLMLVLPYMVRSTKRSESKRWQRLCWVAFLAEIIAFALIERGNSSHHEWPQIVGLGSLIVWIVLLPIYFKSWNWKSVSLLWCRATLAWLAVLILTGWLSFLPHYLDHLKFTNGLVAHSHLAMAGFCTSFLMLLMVEILPADKARILAVKPEFLVWQIATGIYILLMWFSGWKEGNDPGYVIRHGDGVVLLYSLRLLCGGLMFWASVRWWMQMIQCDE